MWTPMNSALDRYHVPLIIYSPMVKKPVSFKSVVSHLSIASTFTSYFNNTLKFTTPQSVHWLLPELDTSIQYRSTISLPFMEANKNIVEYLDKEYFIKNDQLFKVLPDLKIIPSNDEEKKKELIKKLNVFKLLNNYVCSYNKLNNGFLKNSGIISTLYPAHEMNDYDLIKDQTFVNLAPAMKIVKGTNMLKYELSAKFDLLKNTDENLIPVFVIDILDKNSKSVNYGAYKLKDIKIQNENNNKASFSVKMTIQFDLTQKYLQNADEFRVYLYNGSQTQFKYMLIKSEIKAYR
jgi:hypothetical protein